MNTQIGWIFALALGLGAVITTALAKMPGVHLCMASAVAGIYALRGILVHRGLDAAGASRSAIAASNSASMALVWLWGGIAVFVAYALAIVWKEWWHFAVAFIAVGVVSLGFAAMMARDAAAGKEDAAMLKLARTLTWVQLAGMVATMAGLIIDPDKRFLIIREGTEDWAANSIFWFGAAALFVLSAYALLKDKR
jgi:hypothetical protein